MVWISQNDDIRNAKTGCATNLKPKTTTNQPIYFTDVTSVPYYYYLPLPFWRLLWIQLGSFNVLSQAGRGHLFSSLAPAACSRSVLTESATLVTKSDTGKRKLWFNGSMTFNNSLWTYLQREPTTVTNSAGVTLNFNIPQGRSHDFLMLTRRIAASGHKTVAEKWHFN